MSELQQKRPWYNYDILYIIAEKLLAKEPDGGQIDFCYENIYTAFMGHNEMAFRVVIAQFAKFKRIDFIKDGEGQRIEFYLNTDKAPRINESKTSEDFTFGGPYIVPPGMLEYIIEKGKFRVTTIETHNFLPDDHSIDINELGEINSWKVFCALFLGKQIQIPDGLNNNIEIEKFKINERIYAVLPRIQNNFEAILAIDAGELEIPHCPNFIIDCSQYKSSIIANNTTKIFIGASFCAQPTLHAKFATNFETFCPFLIRVCPNLKELHITSSSLTFDEFIDNLYTTIMTLETYIKSINIGDEHLKISICVVANFPPDVYDELPFGNHDLFRFGSAFVIEGIPESGLLC